MGILIGYWGNHDNNESQDTLKRLLIQATMGFGSTGLRVRSLRNNPSSDQPDNTRSIFGIAVAGRHSVIQNTVEDNSSSGRTGLTATVAAAGADFEADIWAKASSSKLVLGRGIFGRATIFWTQTTNAVWFASRLELLLKVVERASISLAGFYSYGCFSYVPAPLTPVKNIFSIRAGTEMIWSGTPYIASPQTLELHQWREANEQIGDEKEAARRLRVLLEESVEAQLKASTGDPIGVFLSGGLDSSVTAALLARAGAKLRLYTLDLGPDCFSEVPYAESVARMLGVPLTKIQVTPSCLRRMLGSVARRLDGLYGDGVTVPLALMCERASKEVRVVFNGEGGDQLFAGWTNKPLIAGSLYEHADSTFSSTNQSFIALYMRTFHRLHGLETEVYTEAVCQELDNYNPFAPLAKALNPVYTRSLLHCLKRANLLLKGADNIQPRATNLGLSYNLDVRTLFCSRSLAEWTFGVSGELWLRAGCEKYLLKRSIEDLLPSEVVWRDKRGMGVPLTLWLTGALRRWTRNQLHPRVLSREGLWQQDVARRVSNGELSGQVQGRRIGETLWLMLMWRAWLECVLQGDAERRNASWRLSLPATQSERNLTT